jgi:hypothetical protein
MKKLIAATFALTLLGAGTVQALTIAIHTSGRHYRCHWDRDHIHRTCRWA